MKESEELKLRSEAERGARAARLLEDSLFRESFAEVERQMTEALINAPVRDTEGVQHLKLMIQCLRRVRAHVTKMAQTGRMADKQLSRWDAAKSKLKRAIGGR